MNDAPTSHSITILIADHGKASLVMSSEVFKDRIPGARVLVAASGKDCLDLAEAERPDMILVDFDLPDADGAAVVTALRKQYNGPIIVTAYPSREVNALVQQELFAYEDCGSVIPKPLKVDDLTARIDQFLVNRFRIDRRFSAAFPIEIRKKATGRGVRTPKIQAAVCNISLGGISCELSLPIKFSPKEELQIVLPRTMEIFKKNTKAKTKVAPNVIAASATDSFLLKAHVAWQNKKEIAFRFDKPTDKIRVALESLLRELILP